MPLPNISDGWRFAVMQTAPGWFAVTTGACDAAFGDATDIANDVALAWSDGDSFAGVQSHDITYDSVEVQAFDGVSDAVIVPWAATDAVNTGGQLGNPTSPPAVCGIVTLKSLANGRRGRGRLFVPGLDESMVASELGEIEGTKLADWQDAAEKFLTTMQSGAAVSNLKVWSRASDALYTVTVVDARRYLGSQRRRQDRVQLS